MEEETIFQGTGNNPQEPINPPIHENPTIPPASEEALPPVETVTQPQESQAIDGKSSVPPPPIPQDHSDGLPIKKILIIVLAIFFGLAIIFTIFLLLSKGRGEEKTNERVVSYWGVSEDPEYMKSVIADFEKANPGIKISYEKQDISNYREKLSTRIPNGNGPDVFSFHNTWVPQIEKDLSPLPTSVITKEQFANNYYPSAQKDLIKDDSIYGIPLETDALALFVNPQILEAAGAQNQTTYEIPKTWQEFIKTSAALTKRDDQGRITLSGAGIGTYDNVEHAPDIISLLFAQNGVNFDDIASSSKKVDDALTFYTNFALFENNVYDNTLDNSLKSFSEGNLAMFFGYASDYFKIKQLNPNLNFVIAPVPQLLNQEKVNVVSYWAEGVSSKSQNKEDSMLFMKYLTKPEVQEKLYQEQIAKFGAGRPYGNKNLAKKLEGTPFHVFSEESLTAVSSPFSSNTFDNGLNDKNNAVLQGLVNSILNGQNNGSPSEVLSSGMQEVVNEINGIQPKPTE